MSTSRLGVAPGVRRQDGRAEPDALPVGGFAVAHARLADRNRADTGHDRTLRQMTVAHDTIEPAPGLEFGMLGEEVCHLRLDGLGEQRTRPIPQDLGERIGEDPWLGEMEDANVSHGVSLLCWRSGGVEHPHDTPPYPLTPSPTSAHSSVRHPTI
jgi:hypothetical protein